MIMKVKFNNQTAKYFGLLCLFCVSSHFAIAQGVGIGIANPDASAKLEVSSTQQGILITRMSQLQRNSILNPAAGLLIYQTDATPGFYYNAGTSVNPNWLQMIPNPSNTDFNVNNFSITNLVAPINSSDAANKGYVDNAIAALGGSGMPTMVSSESASSMNMGNAMLFCDTLTEGGESDWRLPDIGELFKLSAGLAVIPNTRTANLLWTASFQDNVSNWGYYLGLRLSDGYYVISNSNNYVRCVR
jgi:hypothetical protein